MATVDLNVYRFDFDLTFSVLLMNADGTIYHRYGSRDHTSADGHLSQAALVQLLRDGVATHEAYSKSPRPPKALPRRTILDIPAFAARTKKTKVPDCIHCHMVHDAEREQAISDRTWTPDGRWIWPLPSQAGFTLDVESPARIATVRKGSPADRTGLRAGDVVRSANGTRVLTEPDIQWFLDRVDAKGGSLKLEIERGGEPRSMTVTLPKGWKEVGPLEYSWRPFMWQLRPNPGFGGPPLSADEKKKLGLAADAFTLKVQYIIEWGDHPEDGRNAKKAGIRKGDILLSAAGQSDWQSSVHFQTWFRFTRRAGESVDLRLLRDGREVKVRMDVIP